MREIRRVLDLFCKAGGAAMGLHSAFPKAEIVGVDIEEQPRYPFTFVQADAMTFRVCGFVGGSLDHYPEICDDCGRHCDEHFDFAWASPPCQHYCALNTMTNAREHPDLVGPLRERLKASRLPYAIENVFGAPLNDPLMLCGSFFGLESHGFQLRRHRYFETSFPHGLTYSCDHAPRTLGIYGAKVRDIAQEKRHYAKDKKTRGEPVGVVLPQSYGFEAMGIDWMNISELSEAIPPAYSHYVAELFLKTLH